jgi:hypothetical protein
MKNYTRILALVVTFFAFSCEKDESLTCGIANPAEKLPWLRTMIESWEANSTIYPYMYVQQGTYLGQTVFIAGNCCPFCNAYFPVFNCEGEEINGISTQDLTKLTTIWQPENSQCTF